ncbi:MAG: HAD-IIIA family hydrolase [Ruminococcaceae bacterium]|nr:HAD-IIIA family hydrolase [Oscillospiraceae bacterium]
MPMKLKMLVMDVDGTLTDGHIYIGADGEMMKAFHVQDGYAIAHTLPDLGVTPVIITGRKSKIVEKRAAELKITHLHQGISDKLSKLKEVAAELGASAEEIAYIGDDVNDLDCIRWCGVTGCPADAVPEVLEAVSYVCKRDGGRGAVREFINRFLKEMGA